MSVVRGPMCEVLAGFRMTTNNAVHRGDAAHDESPEHVACMPPRGEKVRCGDTIYPERRNAASDLIAPHD